MPSYRYKAVGISGRVVRSSGAPRPELVLRLIARGPDHEPAVVAEATLLYIGPGSLA